MSEEEPIDIDLEQPEEEAAEIAAEGLEAIELPLEADEEGFRHLRLHIRRALPDRRLDKYLAGRLGREVSRTAMQRYIREGNVTVNQHTVKPSYVIQTNDEIDMSLPAVKPHEIPAEPIPLDVVYEDEDVLAVNKQANLIIHPARGNWTGTMVNALAYYFEQNWRDQPNRRTTIKDLPVRDEAFRPGIVHRLDRDTTGILLVAKTELALWRLGRQFELRKTRKTYHAIVHGLMPLEEDVIDVPIGKHPRFREKYAVHRLTGLPYPSTTKDAVTGYRVLGRFGNVGRCRAGFTLVEMYPKTGRTHQLRVHMSYIGYPIVGDPMYGGGPLYQSQLDGRNDVAEGPMMTRQALHARSIEFQHPRTNEPMRLEAPWPADFEKTIGQLRRLSAAV
jgi:23S rRNA pseudouridine1911/1915/1917 synthase